MIKLKKVCKRIPSLFNNQCLFKRFCATENEVFMLKEDNSNKLIDANHSYTKEHHVLQRQWEELMLYGPKISWHKENEKDAQDEPYEELKICPELDRELRKNLIPAKLKILGNIECNSSPELLLNPGASYENVRSMFESLTDVNSCFDSGFPLFTYHNTEPAVLEMCATKILNLQDGMNAIPPTIHSVLSSTMSNEYKKLMQKNKLDFVTNHGVQMFYACREALLSQEQAFYKQLQRRFQSDSSSETNDGHDVAGWASVIPILRKVSHITIFKEDILHPYLHYHGKAACVGIYKNKPVLLEFVFPNSEVLATTCAENLPLCAVAHLGLVNTKELPYKAENVLIVIVNTEDDLGIASTVILKKEACVELWNQWLNRLRKCLKINQKLKFRNHVDLA